MTYTQTDKVMYPKDFYITRDNGSRARALQAKLDRHFGDPDNGVPGVLPGPGHDCPPQVTRTTVFQYGVHVKAATDARDLTKIVVTAMPGNEYGLALMENLLRDLVPDIEESKPSVRPSLESRV